MCRLQEGAMLKQTCTAVVFFHTAVCRDLEATNAILDQTIDKDKMCFVSRQTTEV